MKALYLAVLALAGVVTLSRFVTDPRSDDHRIATERASIAANEATPDSYHHDFGILPVKTTAEHIFLVHNQSDTKWTLEKTMVSCACTATRASSSTIAPGQTEQFAVVFSAGKLAGPKTSKVALIFEGNPTPIELRISATVTPILSAQPELWQFEGNPDQVREKTFRLHYYGEEPIDAVDVVSSPNWVSIVEIQKVEIAESEPRAIGQAFRIKTKAHAIEAPSSGTQSDFFVLAAGNEEISVPIKRIIERRTSANPGKLVAVLRPGQRVSQSVVLSLGVSERNHPLADLDVTVSDEFIVEQRRHRLKDSIKLDFSIGDLDQSISGPDGLIHGEIELSIEATRWRQPIPVTVRVLKET